MRLRDRFLACADRLASGIGTRLFVISRRLKQRLVNHVLEDPDGRLERLKELALRMSEKPDSLRSRMGCPVPPRKGGGGRAASSVPSQRVM